MININTLITQEVQDNLKYLIDNFKINHQSSNIFHSPNRTLREEMPDEKYWSTSGGMVQDWTIYFDANEIALTLGLVRVYLYDLDNKEDCFNFLLQYSTIDFQKYYIVQQFLLNIKNAHLTLTGLVSYDLQYVLGIKLCV